MTKALENTGTLSDIMTAQAKIAMPEVVSIFISKYETELYELKASHQDGITTNRAALKALEAEALAKADFSSHNGIKVPKLKLISYTTPPEIDWSEGIYTSTIGLRDDEPKGRDYRMDKAIDKPISATFLTQHKNLTQEIERATGELQRVISMIGDMSRKERQVKARISELRLKEQGLEGFLADGEMQKLIAID